MDLEKLTRIAKIYRVFDPFRLLRPRIGPLIADVIPNNFPFFRPTQGPGSGPGSGGGSIRARREPILGPVPGPNENFPIPIPPRPI